MRFVIIHVLPENLSPRVERLRTEWSDLTGAREALKYPPHLTLRTGLVVPDSQAEAAARGFLDHASVFGPVPLRTQGLFAVEVPDQGGAPRGFVGWKVEPTQDLLDLHAGLLGFTSWQKGPQGPFHPHVSLAYGDLDLRGLDILRERIRSLGSYELSWTVDHVALYHLQGERWVEWGRAACRVRSPSGA